MSSRPYAERRPNMNEPKDSGDLESWRKAAANPRGMQGYAAGR